MASPIPTSENGATAAAQAGHRTLEIDTKDACLGMFLADLDRPWLETPFLFQGFVISSESELATLRRYCERAIIDLDLSERYVVEALDLLGPREPTGEKAAAQPAHAADLSPDSATQLGVIRPAAPPAATEPGLRPSQGPFAAAPEETYVARSDAPVSRETRDRFRQLLQTTGLAEPVEAEHSVTRRALSKLRAMLGVEPESERLPAIADGHAARLPAHLIASLPSGTQLHAYPDTQSTEAELPRARRAMATCEDAMKAILSEARSGNPVATDAASESVDRLVASMIANPDALLWVARLRDETPQGCQPSIKVALYMVALGRHLGLPKELLRPLGMIGMLADVGKARLPRTLLDKPGQLEPAEYTIAKGHVHLGLELISARTPLAASVTAGIAQHHERLDGSGYPKGLRGSEISLEGRIAGIADSFTALSAPRAYANPLSPQDALMGLYQWSGTLYDQFLVEQFVQAIGVFPVGSLVELSGGEVAVVLSLDRADRLEPRLLLLTRPDKRPLPEPVEADRILAPRIARDPTRRIVDGLPAGAYGLRIRDYYAELG